MQEDKIDQNKKEVDFLVYSGNAVPRVIRLVWTLMAIFLVYYLFFDWDNISQTNFIKDLMFWMSRTKG